MQMIYRLFKNKNKLKNLYILNICFILFLSYLPIYSQSTDRESEFVLLYSTLGYELNSTKRALIRTIDHIDPEIVDTKKSTWNLRDENNRIKMTSSINYLGITYGLQLWEINFSNLQDSGFYKITVKLKNKKGVLIDSLSSLVFEIRSQLYTSRTLIPISIYNAEAREFPVQQGGGYYDCNSDIGEIASHGIFLVGLVNAYERRKQDLSTEYRTRMVKAINIAVDFIISCVNDTTGEIISHPLRYHPHQNVGTKCRQGLFGLVSYAHFFKDEDPVRAKKVFRKALKIIEYLKENNLMTLELEVSAYYHLFKYSGNEKYKKFAISALEKQLNNYEKYGMPLGRRFLYFEGLYYCVKEFKDHPDYYKWIQKAKKIKKQYLQDIIDNNGFHVVPIGGQQAWSDMKSIPRGIKYGFFRKFTKI